MTSVVAFFIESGIRAEEGAGGTNMVGGGRSAPERKSSNEHIGPGPAARLGPGAPLFDDSQ
jgi:hypothetical protein